MTSQNRDRNQPNAKTPADPAAPARRFRIEKLEERIAPSKGGKGTHNCGGGGGGSSNNSGASSGFSGGYSIY